MVKVHCDEGVATHIGPGPCAGAARISVTVRSISQCLSGIDADVGNWHVSDVALPRAEASALVSKPNFGEQAITRPQPGTGQLSHLRRTSQLARAITGR